MVRVDGPHLNFGQEDPQLADVRSFIYGTATGLWKIITSYPRASIVILPRAMSSISISYGGNLPSAIMNMFYRSENSSRSDQDLTNSVSSSWIIRPEQILPLIDRVRSSSSVRRCE